jgi:hypothetical protein
VVRAIDERVLDRCDEVVRRARLHGGGIVEPVSAEALLEVFGERYLYEALPRGVEGALLRWPGRPPYVVMLLEERLRELEQSARRRYVIAHEMAHLLLGHAGSEVVLKRMRRSGGWALQGTFAEWTEGVQERECDFVAAYLLVSSDALHEMEGLEAGYMARILDVPEELVRLRWEIWSKWQR